MEEVIRLLKLRREDHVRNMVAYLSGVLPTVEIQASAQLAAAEHTGAIKEIDHLIKELEK